ncbi:MAG: hypothetical protein J5630_03085, partial [Bacteroidaceae bacterium]|nr:hypothetical protein [Bacteroidaceae bacterium]
STYEYWQQETYGRLRGRGTWQEPMEKGQMKTCMVRIDLLSLTSRIKGRLGICPIFSELSSLLENNIND